MKKNYIIFNNYNTLDFALIEELPLPDRAEPKLDFIEVDGRSGFLTIDNNAYSPIDYSVELIVKGISKIDLIKKVFKGNGKLFLSNIPNRYYKAYVDGVMTFERQVRDVYKCVIEFKLQPFQYELQNNVITMTEGGSIYNYTNYTAQPIIKVYGSGIGILSINNTDFTLNDINTCTILNYELQDAYTENGILRNQYVKGEYDELIEGKNTITWNGGITKIEITPNWRYL